MTAGRYAKECGLRDPFPDETVFYHKLIKDMAAVGNGQIANLGMAEYAWYYAKQPYYNIWPGIIEPLMKVDRTKMPSTHLHLPESSMVMRLAEDNKQFYMHGHPVRGIMVSRGQTSADTKTGCKEIMSIFIQTGEVVTLSSGTQMQHMSFMYLGLRDDLTAQGSFDHIREKFGTQYTPEEMVTAMNLVSLLVGVCMLSTEKEDELIIPDVLSADRDAFERTKDDKYVEKARRRGKFGWDVGKHLTVSPHWRTGHMMLLRSGVRNRQQSRLVWRRGTMVKRNVASQVPTGYAGKESSDGGQRASEGQ